MNERVKQENKITDEELAATKRQLRRNLKEWQKNNTAIAKAKEEARKRELAKEAQAAKEQKEYSDRTAKLLVQERFAQTKEQEKALDEFLSETVSDDFADWIKTGKLELFGDQLYRLPDEEVSLRGIHVLRAGLHIGEFKKNRFEPAFALALTLGREDVKKYVELPSEDMRALGYFNGQSVIFKEGEIDTKLKGWCLFGIDGYSAGWGKIANGQMKNHYPKGLRKNLM